MKAEKRHRVDVGVWMAVAGVFAVQAGLPVGGYTLIAIGLLGVLWP